MKLIKNIPIDKEKFNIKLAEVNSRRTLPAAIFIIVLFIMMFFSQSKIMNNSTDIAEVTRAKQMVKLSMIWSALGLVAAIIFALSRTVFKMTKMKQLSTYIYYALYIVVGFSANFALFLLDGQGFFSYFIVFTLFASLLFLIKPIVSFVVLLLVGLGAVFSYNYIPKIIGMESMDRYEWEVFMEVLAIVCVLALIVSIVMYKHFLTDFNKNYIIENLNEELSDLIKYDSLTKIYNRDEFIRQITKQRNQYIQKKYFLNVAIVDIDYFKQYNDTYGHLQGDECLFKVAQSIQQTINEECEEGFVGRFGGEEFVICIPHKNFEDSLEILKSIVVNIRKLKIVHKSSPISDYLTVSLGGSFLNVEKDYDFYDVFNQADTSLYEAKRTGVIK